MLVIAGHAKGGLAATGVVLIGIGVIVWMLNWLFQLSLDEQPRPRPEEEARDDYSTRHWPVEGAR